MADFTVEDLRKARLPAVVWRELLAMHLIHALPRNAFLVGRTLSCARDLAEDFARHDHRWTSEERATAGAHLGAFEVAELDQRKIPEHPWLILEVQVDLVGRALEACAAERPAPNRARWEAVLRPLWMNMGGTGALPPHLIDTLRAKHRRPFPRAVEFMATLRGIDPNHLRREVSAVRKEVQARRARLTR